MAFWCVREELSLADRMRRSYYEILRDELDQVLLKYALVNSYANFRTHDLKYPYVEKRELKPRARIPDLEYEHQNAFLLLFVEDTIPPIHKKNIRFLNVNKTTKTNLLQSKTLPLDGSFDRTQKYFDSIHFMDFLGVLLPMDFALLIQRDPTSHARDRYMLSHFHVKVDWPIADAAEDLGRTLRYISKDLYEKGDTYAENLQKKFFEYYGLPMMAGGRRSAAIVAAQYLKKIPCISTIYAGSSESRALIRISERGVTRSVLMKFNHKELNQIAETHQIAPTTFKKNYLVDRKGGYGVCIFQTTYATTDQSRPPEDGKLRELKPDLNWQRVDGQHILPKPGNWKYPPLPLNVIYS